MERHLVVVPEHEPHPFLSEHGEERLWRARRAETVDAMRARYREMGHPDDGGAYMVR